MYLSKEDKELYRFQNDQKYRERCIKKLIRVQDNRYNKDVKQLEADIKNYLRQE